MPTVPEYNNFKVMPTTQPVGAMNATISPQAATIGARQIMQAGEQITEGGQRIAAIELDALSQANQIRVDDSLNQLKEASLTLRYNPQTGFENVKGIDALQRASGQSLMQDYGGMLDKQAADIENSLANDAQKRAFRMHANNLITGFKGDIEQHEGREFRNYSLSVREGTIANRMNEIGLNYNNPEAVEQAVRSIGAATYDQARLLGKSAEWAEAQAREATSKAHAVAISTALQKNDAKYADMYLKKFAPEMSADDILRVNGALTKELNGQIGLETANQVIQESGSKISTSDSDRAFNIALGTESSNMQFGGPGSVAGPNEPTTSPTGAIGIAQVMPKTGPEAAKLAGVEWDEQKFRNDPEYNRKLGKAYFDEQLRQNGGNLAMAYAAYNAGPGALEKAKKEAQVKGQPQNWLQELPAETQNYVEKNMRAFGIGAGQFAKPTLYELQQKVRERIGSGQPERLKIALDEVERQYNSIEKATKQRNDEAKATAMRGVMENGGRFTDLPANIRGALAPEDVTGVMDFAKRISLGDDTTSLWLYNDLTANPQKLMAMTDDQFFALRMELSAADFKHFSDERAKMLNGTAPNGPGDLNTDAITRTLNDRLNSMGIDPTPKDASTDAERVGYLRRFVNQSVAAEQLNRGKKMNDVEVSQFIDSLFAQQSKVFSTTLFGNARIAKTGDIPGATKDALRAAFRRKGIDDPSDADLMNAYWRQMRLLQDRQAKAKAAKING